MSDINNKFLMLKVNEEGYVINVSEKLLLLLNYNKVNIKKLHISDIIDFTGLEYKFEDIKILLKQNSDGISIEHRIVNAYRKFIYVYSQYCYEESIEGGYIYINLIDISENKRKEVKSINKYLSQVNVLNEINTNIAIFNQAYKLVYRNKAMKDLIHSINTECYKGIDIFGHVIGEKISKILQAPHIKYEFEHWFEIDKCRKCYNVVIQGMNNGECSVAITDIHKEKVYSQVIENAEIGIVFDGDEGITYLNNKASNILGIKTQYRKTNKKLVEYIDFKYKLKFIEKLSQQKGLKYNLKTRDKKEILISKSLNTIDNNYKDEVVYFIQDKSQIESSEKNNKNFIETIEHEKLKNEFFANISHELRTPINVIFSIVQLTEKSNSIDSKYNKILRQNCYRLLRLINNLIEITKIDVGHVKLSLSNVNIINVVEDITLSVAQYIEGKGLELSFDTEVEEKMMACDPEKIESIILNLLANASKFTEPGDKIEVYIQEELKDKIKIRIKDSGKGIPKEKIDIIFKRFRQVDKSLYRSHEGSGIGLSLVKTFVELHGGNISVESEVGVGSEFIIILPVKVVEEESIKELDEYNQEHIIDKINIEFSDIYFNE